MVGIFSSWAFLFEHPLIGIAVLVAVSLGVLLVLSGGNLADSIGAMVRVTITFFTTPFTFLRDSLTNLRSSAEDEEDYRQSRVFMMFRFNKLQYLGLLVLCLLMLSSGITSSLLTLYPSYEIEQGRVLDEEIARLETEEVNANQAVAAAGAPGHREQLQTQRDQARSAYQYQVQNNAEFARNTTFSGPLISQLANTRNQNTIENVRANIDNYMSSCPRGYNWRGMTVEMCGEYRTFVLELADRKTRELQLETAAREADQTLRQAGSASENAANALSGVQARLEMVRQQRAQVSLFNPDMIGARLGAAAMGLLMTLLSVIIMVWLGASLISFFSWLILMMRGLEIMQADKLRQSRPPET